MEIREQPIDDAKAMPWLNENARLFRAGTDVPVADRIGGGLERSNDRGPHGDDRRTPLTSARDRGSERAWDLEILGVHHVIVEILCGHGLKRPEADVEGTRSDLA